jgi:acyl-CoA thioesterase YciA
VQTGAGTPFRRTAETSIGLPCHPAISENTSLMEDERLNPAIRVIMMPKDTNARGTIFGGVILSYIDQAAAIEAHRQFNRNFVTKAMNAVEFVAPVQVGDVVSFYARVIRLGRTSVAVQVDVEAEGFRQISKQLVRVTQAEVVCVSVNDEGHPVPFRDEQ